MTIRTLFGPFGRKNGNKNSVVRRLRCFRPWLERLEDRAVPATTIGTNFQSSQLFTENNNLSIPPDTMGDIGPNHIVEMINGNFEIFDRAGNSVEERTLNSFWVDRAGAVIPAGGTFDPRVVYDHASQRWFATSINGGAANTIFVARSDTNNPTGDWDSVTFIGDTVFGTRFCDYDTLGIDADGVYIATNNFIGSTFTDVSIFSIPKVDLLLAAPTLANMTRFEYLAAADRGTSIQGNLDYAATDGMAAIIGDVGGTLRRSFITGAGAAGAQLGASAAIAGVPVFAAAPAARQPNSPALENVSPRFTGHLVKQGAFLWAVHAVTGTLNTSAVRWYQINEATNTVVQTGLIENANVDYHEPSIFVNPFGIVVIGYTGSGPATFAGSFASVGITATVGGVPTTTFDPPLLLRAGAGNYFRHSGNSRNRWGDYSATRMDPTDPMRFRTFQEFVAVAHPGPDFTQQGGAWGVQVTELQVHTLDITISANHNANNIVIRRDATATILEVEIDSVLTDRFLISSLNSLTINGLDGNDTIAGAANLGAFGVSINGGAGTDSIVGGAGNDNLTGGTEADTLFGGLGNDSLVGDAGNDSLLGHDGFDTLSGGNDNDSLDGGLSPDRLFGGAGNDFMRGLKGADSLDGGAGNDTLNGNEGPDTLFGDAGNDTLNGAKGADSIDGGADTDRFLHSDDGNMILENGQFKSTSPAGTFVDTLFSIEQAELSGGGTDNSLDARPFLLGPVTLRGAAGNDTLFAGSGDDELFGDGDNDSLNGGAGRDTLRGGDGNDKLYGLTGIDSLLGEEHDDSLVGGGGNDSLDGGNHTLGDTLAGGGGTADFCTMGEVETGCELH